MYKLCHMIPLCFMYLEYLQSSLLAGTETILSRGNSSLLGTEKVHILTLMLTKEAHNAHIVFSSFIWIFKKLIDFFRFEIYLAKLFLIIQIRLENSFNPIVKQFISLAHCSNLYSSNEVVNSSTLKDSYHMSVKSSKNFTCQKYPNKQQNYSNYSKLMIKRPLTFSKVRKKSNYGLLYVLKPSPSSH